jgi:hypothetical protein
MLSDYAHLIGGISGGTVSTLVCHPLDFLRIRYAGKLKFLKLLLLRLSSK